MQIDNENTFRLALSEGINLFTGAGFSVLAKDERSRHLPISSGLTSELIEEFKSPDTAGLSLSQICTIIEHTQKEQLRSYLKSRFSVGSFDSRYYSLERLNIKNIFTTNIDDLIFKIYTYSNTHYLNDLDVRGASFNDKTAIDVVTLCGCVLDDVRPFSFNTLDLAAAFRADPDRWHLLTGHLQKYPTLFWGYSVGDSSTLEALNPATVKGRPLKDRWIVLRPETDTGTRRYFSALNLQIILADTNEILDYVGKIEPIKPVKRERTDDRSTRELFPDEAIPDIATVPVRPLTEFFLGAAPSWHDVFSGRLHRTKHFLTVRNSINSKRHTIIIGLPASGKSTLMLQVAQDINFNGHKLVCEAPTAEKAKLMVTKLDVDNAIIFVDNFADSVDAFQYFMDQPKVLVVGCDRDYNFDIISHKLDLATCNVIDVTDLDDSDIQQILSQMPIEIKSSTTMKSGYPSDIPLSLFELIEGNIIKTSLHRRFQSVLQQLEKQDARALEFLLVCCYVHRCRTPISMDMLLAFFRDQIDSYEQIYDLRHRVGTMVTDYIGELDDFDQDYYFPRSTLVAEAIIDQASPGALRRMIQRFHEQVSPYRIHRFDIFRRRAYDAGLMRRVFGDWTEGRDFYELAYERDASPYMRQQCALYLAHKAQFVEAFNWIDQAVVESEERVPSIRNSHAIILFKANIEREETDGTVLRTLDRSMEILVECYVYDKRKAYHATTFGDQALRYWERYGNEVAREYLLTAGKWLANEAARSPWNRNVSRMRNVVMRKIDSVAN